MIDIVALSDMHGTLPKIEKSFDLMLIAGDCVDLTCQRVVKLSEDWYLEEFLDWVDQLPFKDEQSKIILIAGNHDVGLEKMSSETKQLFLIALDKRSNSRVVYLENELYIYKHNDEEISIFGTPYCKIFGNWAFMGNDDWLKFQYSKIPEKVDILLTHDAPYGTSDRCYGWLEHGRTPIHIGNEPLRDAIIDKNPIICIHGHLHSSNHDVETLANTKVYNVSILDENYEETYKPFYFIWPLLSD